MRKTCVLIAMVFAGVNLSSPASSAVLSNCAVAVSDLHALGFSEDGTSIVYGFNISRADKAAIDAQIVAQDSAGARLQNFEVLGTLPTSQSKTDWTGLAFAVIGNGLASIAVAAESDPGSDGVHACSAPGSPLERVQKSKDGSTPIRPTDYLVLALPASLVPASIAIEPLRVQYARPTYMAEASYPPAEQFAGRQGTAAVAFAVGTDGVVSDVTVMATSGHLDFDKSARAAALASKYRPALVNGIPVVSHEAAFYSFILNR
ncbi:MAG TPA: energy transducer TonB [Candidatus Eremiobacteraceae bacterium]|nr:energy transducer TonB [Candidatus Eremiobacteraceae bacterium]